MTRDEALVRMKKLFGDRARCTVLREVTSPECRAAARSRYETALAEKEKLRRQIDEMFGEQIKAIDRQIEHARSEANRYKFQLYKHEGIFDVEVAKGDTWEDVFANLRNSSHGIEAKREKPSPKTTHDSDDCPVLMGREPIEKGGVGSAR